MSSREKLSPEITELYQGKTTREIKPFEFLIAWYHHLMMVAISCELCQPDSQEAVRAIWLAAATIKIH